MTELAGLSEFEAGLMRTVLHIRTKKQLGESLKKKAEKGLPVVPDHALLLEIKGFFPGNSTDEVKKGLWGLCKKKYLRWGDTVNDIYFEIISGKDEK